MTELRVAETAVMGRLAVLTTTAWLGLAGIIQLSGFPGSEAITEAGGRQLVVVWSVCLILAFVLVLAARLIALRWRRGGDAYAAVIEGGGIVLLVLGLVAYVIAIFAAPRIPSPPVAEYWPAWAASLEGRLVLLALTGAAITNSSGRALLLVRQSRRVTGRRA